MPHGQKKRKDANEMAEVRIAVENHTVEDINNLITNLDVGLLWLETALDKLHQDPHARVSALTYQSLDNRIKCIRKLLFQLVTEPRY